LTLLSIDLMDIAANVSFNHQFSQIFIDFAGDAFPLINNSLHLI